MSVDALRLIARAHAAAAWIATAALCAAAWAAFGEPPRRARSLGASLVATLAITAAFALGLLLEDTYRARLRQRLFARSPSLGWLFERKEHLAFGAVLLGWSALLSLTAAELLAARARRRNAGDESLAALASDLRRAAWLGCVSAAVFALAATIASAIAASNIHL